MDRSRDRRVVLPPWPQTTRALVKPVAVVALGAVADLRRTAKLIAAEAA